MPLMPRAKLSIVFVKCGMFKPHETYLSVVAQQYWVCVYASVHFVVTASLQALLHANWTARFHGPKALCELAKAALLYRLYVPATKIVLVRSAWR